MAWLGIWFEHEAEEGKARSHEWFQGLVPPVVYPYAHSFIEAEEKRLRRNRDPGSEKVDGERYSVYYSINHDGGQTGVDQQGCRILQWLFGHFAPGSASAIGSRFSEIPIVIHSDSPQHAAALGNALTLLRFLAAAEDQAIAKMMIWPWSPFRPGPRLAALEYEKRVIEFLHGEIFYPEDIDLFDILERNDLRAHRTLAPCCKTQIGFIEPLLEWIDDCWPKTPAERLDLRAKLTRSLADEASYLARLRERQRPRSAQETFR